MGRTVEVQAAPVQAAQLQVPPGSPGDNRQAVRWLTVLMFLMFAMTTDSVGVIIPQIVKQFHLSQTHAGYFQYATMSGLAFSAIALGFLADRIGRKRTIILGLTLFAAAAFLFTAGDSFLYFVSLVALVGAAIGIFKTGVLALIGDICESNREHTSFMNLAEGFFGIGAIIGPAITRALIDHGVSWKWLYSVAGSLCLILMVLALRVQYPATQRQSEDRADIGRSLRMLQNPYALGFGAGIFLYVAVENAVVVWGPTFLDGYHGSFMSLAAYSVTAFFVLRALGRFIGSWLLRRFDWNAALALLTLGIFLCMLGSALGGARIGLWLLPLSGLFMSVIYPTLNSKGISCFEKSEHGAIAGVILFFTCAAAVIGPYSMARLMDAFVDPRYAFGLAATLAALLFLGALYNWLRNPARARLAQLEVSEYQASA